jgi:putative MATE family efflux protein
MVTMATNGLYRGSGNTMFPMVVMASSAVLNLLLDPFLIYGWWVFPRLGIAGAGWATLLSQLLGFVLVVGYLRSRHSGYHLRAGDLRLRLATLRDLSHVGGPAVVMHGMRGVFGVVINWFLSPYGAAALAAQGLTLRVMMLIISFIGGGVSQGLMPIVGYCFGAKDYRRMWRAYVTAAVGTSGLGLLLSVVAVATAPLIIGVFTDDPELLRLGTLALRVRVLALFLMEPQMMAVVTLEGMGKGLTALFLSVTRQVLLVLPLLFLLAHYYGVLGIFTAQPVAEGIGIGVVALVLYHYYHRYPPAVAAEAAGA